MSRPSGKIAERFVKRFGDRFEIVTESGCWVWTAGGIPDGYGTFPIGGDKRELAHRFSWRLHNGNIPEGMCVLHRCDVPSCVNPHHLFLGTHQDNMADRDKKGRCRARGPKGEANGSAKLTEEAVKIIRESGKSRSEIARDFGVSPAAVGLVRRRKVWGWMP